MGVINQGLSKQHFSVSILVSYLKASCSCTVIHLAADSNTVNAQRYELIDEDATKHTRCTSEDCVFLGAVHAHLGAVHTPAIK